ncbi:MAG: carbohydrate ABC transporter permease [Alphaproteobacteria bacterium]
MAALEAEALARPPRPGGSVRDLLDSERWLGRFMMAPAILYIAALVGFPFFLAIFYSVSDVTVASQTVKFVGLKNYRGIMESATFWESLRNTFIFAFAANLLVVVLAKMLAMALLKDFRGKWVVRFLILLPWVAPISLGAIGWLWILDSIYSPIDWTLRQLGLLGGPDAIFGPLSNLYWLGQPDLAMISIITVHVWRMLPLATVIILAGLTSIPQDIHDAAAMDGAGFWRRLFQITIPLVLPILLVALLFGIVFTFTDLIVIFILTRGGPYDSTQVLASWAYFTGIDGGDLAEGAAIALFLFPLLVVVAIVFLLIARRAEVT